MDMLSLSALTMSHICHAMSDFLSSHPNRVKLLHEPSCSYLQYILRRYGRSRCLDYAVDALVFKVREAMCACLAQSVEGMSNLGGLLFL